MKKISFKCRMIAAVTTVAFSGQTLLAGDRIPTLMPDISMPSVGSGGSTKFKPGDFKIDKENAFPGPRRPTSYCPTTLPSTGLKNVLGNNTGASRVEAPIWADVGPCDMPRLQQCSEMLIQSLVSPAQALYGSDVDRDAAMRSGSGGTYTQSDVHRILNVVKSWNAIKHSATTMDTGREIPQKTSAEEKALTDVLAAISLEGFLSSENGSKVSSVHLKLSEELTIAAEAFHADPGFVGYASGANGLLQTLNPSAFEGFSCLVGFAKNKMDQKVKKGERKVVGYFSGVLYGTATDDTRANYSKALKFLAAYVPVVLSLFGLADSAADRNQKEKDRAHEAAENDKQRKHEAEMAEKQRAHDAAERAKDRELEREKLEAEKNKQKPKVIDNPDQKEDDELAQPDKDNKHYMNPADVNCLNLDYLDAHDPKKNPSLVTDYDRPEPESEKIDKEDRPDLYTTYVNPADLLDYKFRKVVDLDDFRLPDAASAAKCRVETRN